MYFIFMLCFCPWAVPSYVDHSHHYQVSQAWSSETCSYPWMPCLFSSTFLGHSGQCIKILVQPWNSQLRFSSSDTAGLQKPASESFSRQTVVTYRDKEVQEDAQHINWKSNLRAHHYTDTSHSSSAPSTWNWHEAPAQRSWVARLWYGSSLHKVWVYSALKLKVRVLVTLCVSSLPQHGL